MRQQSNHKVKHSTAIDEIISAPPAWLMRWGVTVFAILLIVLGIISNFLHYPEMIDAKLIIVNGGISGVSIAPANGIIVKALVKDNLLVKQEQPVMIIKSSGGKLLTVLAPGAGKLSYLSLVMENQEVKKGEKIFYILSNSNKCYGRILIAQDLVGKIKKGQQALMELDLYPPDQYGVLTGSLDSLGNSPDIYNQFELRTTIHNSFNKKIILYNGLTGNAKIILSNETLLERLTGHLIKQ